MASSSEHWEIWSTHPVSGERRHQKAMTLEDATAVAIEHGWATSTTLGEDWVGMHDIEVQHVVTTVTTIDVVIPPRPVDEDVA